MNYLLDHWRGKTPLAIAFWINFVLVGVVFNYLERFTLPPFLQNEFLVMGVTIAFSVVLRLLVYTWQVVGLLRACDNYLNTHTDRTWVLVTQAMVVVSVAAIVIALFGTYQNLIGYKQSLKASPPELQPDYTLTLTQNDSLVHLEGPIQVGITRAMTDLLERTPSVSGVILDSGGGRIYEGRGLAKLILAERLDTYVLKECMSACTTAFVAGKNRTLAKGARLGFHQYAAYVVYPKLDPVAEQAKDAEIFKNQGISSGFLEKMFRSPPEEMWWPTAQELVDAGVVHRTDFIYKN